MLAPTVPAICRLAILAVLACRASSAAAQSAVISHPGALKGFDPQPDPPGKLKVPGNPSAIAIPGLKGTAGPDVTSKKGITIGQTFATWGTFVNVPVGQAYAVERGKCAFRMSYDMVNQRSVATPLVFKNTLSAGPAIVSTDDSLLLGGLQAKQVNTHAWLPPGTYDLILRLDAGNSVPETDEVNNAIRVRLTLDGKCQGQLGANIPAATGDEKAHVPFLPPGTVNTADQTNERPAPRATGSGYDGPGTKPGNPAMIDVDGSGIIQNGRRALAQRLGPAASAIIVQFDGGVMTLSGKVPSQEARAEAEQAVRSVPGLLDVENKLLVATP